MAEKWGNTPIALYLPYTYFLVKKKMLCQGFGRVVWFQVEKISYITYWRKDRKTLLPDNLTWSSMDDVQFSALQWLGQVTCAGELFYGKVTSRNIHDLWLRLCWYSKNITGPNNRLFWATHQLCAPRSGN